MVEYPENSWIESDEEKVKDAYFSEHLIEVECPAPNCDGIVDIHKITDVKEKYKKRGDYLVDFKCRQCKRDYVSHQRGHFRI